VTVVAPGFEFPGSDGDVGFPLLLVVVVVFAIPPHAHATSAKRTGNMCAACATENLAEPLADRIAGAHLEWIYPAFIFGFERVYRLLDKGIAVGQCPQREVFPQKTLKNPARCGVLRYAISKTGNLDLTPENAAHAPVR
jgi:hypothetical protein